MRNSWGTWYTERLRLATAELRFLLVEGLWGPRCWPRFRNGKQRGPPRNLWKGLSCFCAYYLICHFCFSLNVVFLLEVVISCKHGVKFVGKGSRPLIWACSSRVCSVALVFLTCACCQEAPCNALREMPHLPHLARPWLPSHLHLHPTPSHCPPPSFPPAEARTSLHLSPCKWLKQPLNRRKEMIFFLFVILFFILENNWIETSLLKAGSLNLWIQNADTDNLL